MQGHNGSIDDLTSVMIPPPEGVVGGGGGGGQRGGGGRACSLLCSLSTGATLAMDLCSAGGQPNLEPVLAAVVGSTVCRCFQRLAGPDLPTAFHALTAGFRTLAMSRGGR